MLESILPKTFIPSVAMIALMLMPTPAFAQRGGGHGGGGGFHGGGGGFRGGGFGGGGYRGAAGFRGGIGGAYRAGFGGPRSFGGGAYRGGGLYGARSSSARGYRGPYGSGRGLTSRGWAASQFGRGFSGGAYGARGGAASRNWQSFGGARAGFHNQAIADGHWHSFGASRGAFTTGTNGFGNRGFKPGWNRGWNGRGWGGWGWHGRGGCWGCGFGWGFGWGWGWGWPWAVGWWGPGWAWGPYWYDPWWGWPPYGYNYPASSGYLDNGPPYAPPPDQEPGAGDSGDSNSYGPPYAPPDADSYSGVAPESEQNQQDPGPAAGKGTVSLPTLLLYLTDGAVYPVTRYWISGSTVHYIVAYGGENSVPLTDVDIGRTTDENAKRGVRFDLRPKSYSGAASSPTASARSENAAPE